MFQDSQVSAQSLLRVYLRGVAAYLPLTPWNLEMLQEKNAGTWILPTLGWSCGTIRGYPDRRSVAENVAPVVAQRLFLLTERPYGGGRWRADSVWSITPSSPGRGWPINRRTTLPPLKTRMVG
jgi:hypothetical protein